MAEAVKKNTRAPREDNKSAPKIAPRPANNKEAKDSVVERQTLINYAVQYGSQTRR